MKRQTDDARSLTSAIHKATVRLIPFLCLAYTVNFLDRVNVGFAALHMNEDLGFSPSVYGFGAGIFFLGYIAFEIPSNLALRRFGARLWIARIMVSWGLVACAMALVHSQTSFYVTRALLGIAEAGFFPGIILYLTYWFPAAERARIVALFMASVPLATVIGGPVSGALLELDGLFGFAGWQWLFVIQGIPAVLLGILALKVLTGTPHEADWLSDSEKTALTRALDAEAKETAESGYADLRAALTRPRVLALGGLYFLMVTGLYGIGFWMPQVIGGFGLDPLAVGFLTAIPYLFAAVAMVVWGRHSDATGERRWHIALPLLLAAGAFAWSAYSGPLLPTMVALTIATLGFYAAFGPFWAMPTALLTGAGAAAGIALVNSMGNAAGFAGPYIVGILKEATGSFSAALLFLAAALALGGLMALCFRAPGPGAQTARS
ncbi:MFS transporter [Methyloceanibacter sp.]|uniref:MFS transporter n=1 Tax=Methyloceanibacter sp. TaxID=1965321 RepID=UPI002B8699D6|nr:MFS transporter [Methyloceanibacter sp.]HML91456.1 MFS transporter [Methyloceanibacter sp.]